LAGPGPDGAKYVFVGERRGYGGATPSVSIGLRRYATMLKSRARPTPDNYQAQKLKVAAQYGDLKAVQTAAR